jgi:UDP-glucose 4-epimerase
MGESVRYLVTGGAGFIGSHLAERLLRDGHRVRVLDDFSTGRRANLAFGADDPRLEVVEGDIRDAARVRAAMGDIEGVFHQAALVSVPRSVACPRLSLEINALGTLTVFDAARETGVPRVVFASSAAVYGAAGRLPLAETSPPAPTSPYGLDKLYTEQLAALYRELFGFEAVALRYFNVFGPRQDPSSPYAGVISIFRDRLAVGEAVTVFGDGEQTRDFVYVEDVVAANLAAMTAPAGVGAVYNVGRGERVSLNQLLAMLGDILGRRPVVAYQPPRPGDIRHSQGDISAIQSALGWAPRWNVPSGLSALVESQDAGEGRHA